MSPPRVTSNQPPLPPQPLFFIRYWGPVAAASAAASTAPASSSNEAARSHQMRHTDPQRAAAVSQKVLEAESLPDLMELVREEGDWLALADVSKLLLRCRKGRVCVCACACVCVCLSVCVLSVRACMLACVGLCVCTCVLCVRAWVRVRVRVCMHVWSHLSLHSTHKHMP